MRTSARVENRRSEHVVTVATDGTSRSLVIAPRATGFGSSVNGGELLALAVATCYCNDLYREAAALGIELRSVSVEARAVFGAPGAAATRISYSASVEGDAPDDILRALLERTDRVAEVHNTLRGGIAVTLEPRADAST